MEVCGPFGRPSARFATLLVLLATAAQWQACSGAVTVPAWLSLALRAQTILSAGTDVSQLAQCAANDAFNALQFSPAKWRAERLSIASATGACVSTQCLKGVADIHSQDLSVSDLLDIGVRRLALNLQYIPDFSSATRIRFCRGDNHFFYGCNNLKTALGFDVCSILFGIPTLSSHNTGCSEKSQTMLGGLMAISDWITQRMRTLSYDVIIVDISDFMSPTLGTPAVRQEASQGVLDAIRATVGNFTFTTSDLINFRAGTGVRATAWPTPKQMVDVYQKRVILMTSPSALFNNSYLHPRPNTMASGTAASNTELLYARQGYLMNSTCPASVTAFQTVFESRKLLHLDEVDDSGLHRQNVSRENGPAEIGLISNMTATALLNCGISPGLDLVNILRIQSSCLWTYAPDAMVPQSNSTNVRVVFNDNSGWTTSTTSNADATFGKACQSVTDSNAWTISGVGQSCPATHQFAIPASARQASQLRSALRAANVRSVLLPTNVTGVTVQPAVPQSGGGNGGGSRSSSSTVGIAVGVSVGIVVAIAVIVVIVLVIRQRQRASSEDGMRAGVVTNAVTDQEL